MDLLQIIKLMSIPKWVKFFSLIIISLFLGLAVYAIFGGRHLADGSILQAGMGLVGVLLPLAVAMILLSFYEAGIAPLRKATVKFLTQLIPSVLTDLGRTVTSDTIVSNVTVKLFQQQVGHYSVRLSNKQYLQFLIQLNVKKVCVVFYLPTTFPGGFAELESKLKHTLFGARHEGYRPNEVTSEFLGQGKLAGIQCSRLVLYKTLPPDFLWNSAEKLYFAQDLQVMIESLMDEGAELLRLKELP